MATIPAKLKSKPSERSSILGVLSERTRAIALVALVVEALFLAGGLALPEAQRIYAFGICAFLLILAMAACVWLESQQAKVIPKDTPLRLPKEMEGHYLLVDGATKTSKGTAADLYRVASNLKFAGRYEDAVTYYQRTLGADPNHIKARYNIGSCLFYLQRLDDAKEHFQRLVAELEKHGPPQDPMLIEILHGCFIQLNNICAKQGAISNGVPFLVESLRVKPEDPLSFLNLTIAALRLGNLSEARKWYQMLFGHSEYVQVLSSLSDEDRTLINGLTDQ